MRTPIIRWLALFFFAVTVINYPNPFDPKGGENATFECTSDATFEAALCLYDLSAHLLWRDDLSLVGGSSSRAVWNGYDNDNRLVGNGIYLYRLVDRSSGTLLGRGKVWVINR